MDNIAILGSSGHTKVIIDIMQQDYKYNVAGLLDRFRDVGKKTLGYSVLGKEVSIRGSTSCRDYFEIR
jgi:hypothetical protein